MAKGIRSKAMRKNRSLLRKQIVDPLTLKRATEASNKIQQSLSEKSGSTIISLKQSFVAKQGGKPEEEQNDEEEVEMEEVSEKEGEEKKELKIKIDPSKVFKKGGKKPRNNNNKTLVWF